jgi:hypothetical protein
VSERSGLGDCGNGDCGWLCVLCTVRGEGWKEGEKDLLHFKVPQPFNTNEKGQVPRAI